MSYHRYQTECFVLRAADSGESSKVFSLFTRELGRVEAYAQGIRELKSKLRYGLQEHAYVYVELVQGKGMWRVVSAEPMHAFDAPAEAHHALYARILSLVRNLVHGETDDPRLFDELCDAFTFLAHVNVDTHELRAFEALLVMRMLSILGYWADTNDTYAHFLQANWAEALIREFAPLRRHTLADINTALRETQL